MPSKYLNVCSYYIYMKVIKQYFFLNVLQLRFIIPQFCYFNQWFNQKFYLLQVGDFQRCFLGGGRNYFSSKSVNKKRKYLNAEKRIFHFGGKSLFLLSSQSSSPVVPNCKVHGKEDATITPLEIRDKYCIKAIILFRKCPQWKYNVFFCSQDKNFMT